MHNYTATTQNAYQYKYNGKELQETGNLDYGWRQYMPDIGRWFGIDPMAEKSHAIMPYRYSFNNPMSYVDPDGLWEIRVETVKGQKVMTFVAQKDDTVETLAQQTGLNLEDLQKGLAGEDISEGKALQKLGIEKIDKMIIVINKLINTQDRARSSNCWGTCISFGKNGRVSFNLTKDSDNNPTGIIGDPNKADEILQNEFKQTDKPKFGDIRRYAYADGNKRSEEDFTRYGYNQVNDGAKAGGTSHYATFLLQNGSGTVYIFSKNGSTEKGLWNVNSESTLLGDKDGYGQPTPIGKGSPNYTKK